MNKLTTKTVTVYTTSDGKEFFDPTEAAQHQYVLDNVSPVERYVTGIADDKHRVRVRNMLMDFIKFRAQDEAVTA